MKRPPFFLLPTLGFLALATACGKDNDTNPNFAAAPVEVQNPDGPLEDEEAPPVNNSPLDPLTMKKRYTVQIKSVNDRLVDGYTKPIYVRPGDVVSLSADLYDMKTGEAQFRNNSEFSWKAQGSREICHGYDTRTCYGSGFLVDDLYGVNFIVPFNFMGSMKLNTWWSRNDYRVVSVTLIAIRDNGFDPFFGLFPRWNPQWDRDGKGTHWNRNWNRNWNGQWNAPRERRWWKKEKRNHVITEPNPQRGNDRRDEDREGRRSDSRDPSPQTPPQLPAEVKQPPKNPRKKDSRQSEKGPRKPVGSSQDAPLAKPQPLPAPTPAPTPANEENKPEAKPERKAREDKPRSQREEKPKKDNEEQAPPAPQENVPAPNPPPQWIDEAPAAPTTPVEEVAAPAPSKEEEDSGETEQQPKKPRKQRQ